VRCRGVCFSRWRSNRVVYILFSSIERAYHVVGNAVFMCDESNNLTLHIYNERMFPLSLSFNHFFLPRSLLWNSCFLVLQISYNLLYIISKVGLCMASALMIVGNVEAEPSQSRACPSVGSDIHCTVLTLQGWQYSSGVYRVFPQVDLKLICKLICKKNL
jgi:hypothetical protein